jgi:hypothetical protein
MLLFFRLFIIRLFNPKMLALLAAPVASKKGFQHVLSAKSQWLSLMIKAKIMYGVTVFSIAAVLSVVGFRLDLAPWFSRAGWSPFSGEAAVREEEGSDGSLASNTRGSVDYQQPWPMHLLDPKPPSGADGVKLADVNGDGWPDLVTGFEEGGVSRIYINPGPDKAHQHWQYVELPSPDVEDAVLVDLDNNGIMDLVTASEGATNKIMFHWAPANPKDYLDASKWQSQTLPVADGLTAWMFVVPTDLDGQHGVDLIVGSKRKAGEKGDDKAVVGWLRSAENLRDISKWTYYPLTKAGWVMSIEVVDMNGDGQPDILISDRKFSTQTGVRWLENPGKGKKEFFTEWKSHLIGVAGGEPMFLAMADLSGDGRKEIVIPDLYKGLKIFQKPRASGGRWELGATVPYPAWAGPRGKAAAVGDIDLDGNPDIVLSFEEEGKVASIPYEAYQAQGKYSVIWGSFQEKHNLAQVDFQKVSGLKGRKFDLVTLIDLDGDGDLDVLTNDENEEGDGLGVVWYENPTNK